MAKMDPATQEQLAELSMKLAANAETRKAFAKLVKKVDPGIHQRAFTDLIADEVREDLAREKEEDRIKAESQRIKDDLEAQRKGLLATYSEDQIKEIEKVMERYGIANYDAGAKIYAADRAPVQENGRKQARHGERWTLPDLPGLMKDPIGAARDAAYGVIDELNAKRG